MFQTLAHSVATVKAARDHGATLKRRSKNGKLGESVTATYLSIQATCPATCALRSERTCYAQHGNVGMTVRRLDRSGQSETAVIAEAWSIEAEAWSGRARGMLLRSGVSGDCTDPSDARRLGAAFREWNDHGGGRVWKYTHAWRHVRRNAYGSFRGAVLASVDHWREISAAREQGYMVFAIVVDAFPNGAKSWTLPDGTKAVPCPAQTSNRTCSECQLCTRDGHGHAIAFQAHGSAERRLVRRLTEDGKQRVFLTVH